MKEYIDDFEIDLDTEEDDNAEEVAEQEKKKRNRLIANLMIYGGIAILVILCIVTGIFLFMGQSGRPITTLRFAEQSLSMRAGHSASTALITEPSDMEYAITYASSDDETVKVDADGKLTALKAGTATVTAYSGELNASCQVTVERDTLSGFDISISEADMTAGDELAVKVTYTPADASDKDMVWESSDTAIATVSEDGVIKALSGGDAVITVTDKITEISRDINVSVEVPETAESMLFDKDTVTLEVGDKYETVLKFEPDSISAKYAVYYTTDTSIASVDEYGIVTANSAGVCTISAVYYYDDSIKATMELVVLDPFVITGAQTETEPPATEPPATDPPETEPPATDPPQTQTPPPTGMGVNGPPEITEVDGITYVNGIMIANKTYSLPASYDPGAKDDAMNAFYEMQNAAYADGISLYIISGYRSYYTQQAIYNNYVSYDGVAGADRYSARAGHSEHQTGYAFDLNSLEESFGETAEGRWLADNCYKYGFIIRYPKGKEPITGYMYEPWHVRYLGKDIATSVYNSGLTLEEYLGITSEYQD